MCQVPTSTLKKQELKQKKSRNEYLNEINKPLLLAKIQKNSCLPHHIVLNLIKSSKATFYRLLEISLIEILDNIFLVNK